MKFPIQLLLLVILTGFSFGQTNKYTLISNPAFEHAVAKQIRFPGAAQRLGKSVRIYVAFKLTDDGSYQDIAVVNLGPVDELFKQEVDRLWRVLPKQDPIYTGNYVIPIAFMLGEGGPDRLKPISNQEDRCNKQGGYTLLKEVSVIGWLECERKTFLN